MKVKILYILFLIFTIPLFGQTVNHLAVQTQNGIKYLPVYDRQGTIYFPIEAFAGALSINYYYNAGTEKIELKFPAYYLKITANNPFLILYSKKNGKQIVYQLPTSTYLLNNQIFVPLIYIKKILETASGYILKYSYPDKLSVLKKGTNNDLVNTRFYKHENNVKYNISGIKIEQKANGTLIRVESNKRILSYNSFFKDGILTIIFRNVLADIPDIERSPVKGLIKKIEVKNVNSGTEFRFTLNDNYSNNEVLNVDYSNDILIALHNKVFVKNSIKEREKKKWSFKVVVIDPGHGGRDYGTIGLHGIKEKNINLKIALKLGKILKKNMKDIKVVFTRKTDKFVPLYKRGQIANKAGGNLFISIHCNSTQRKSRNAEGYEIYLLRPGKTKEAIRIAEKENSVIKYENDPARYKKLTDENFILVSMAQASYMKYSEEFSDILNKEFSKDIDISSRGIKQAGFFVLVGASMPSVLIEAGFLSNPHDAAYLNSNKGQTQIAKAIYEAIKKFKKQYAKSFNTG